MTYMAGSSAEIAIECSGFQGIRGQMSFENNEHIYFLGQKETSGASAESLGFPGYFFLQEHIIGCVSRYDVLTDTLYFVQGFDEPISSVFPPRNRGFIKGDIVVGSKTGATRKVGVDFILLDGEERCSIKELFYQPSFHDLLNFNSSNKMFYDRSNPINYNFYSNTFFSNFDHKFGCISISDRYSLPVPYTANKFGFRMACAVTPLHVIIANHVAPYSTNQFYFYDHLNKEILTRNVISYKSLDSLVDFASINGFDKQAYKRGDIALGVLNEPLPEHVKFANIPAYQEDFAFPDYASIKGIAIAADMRGYCLNLLKSSSFGCVNQFFANEKAVDKNSMIFFSGVGDSNTMIFMQNNKELLFCGPVVSISQSSSAGLNGKYIGDFRKSRFEFNFLSYPNELGILENSPKNRYRMFSYECSVGSFISLNDNLCNYVFTNKDLWGINISSSFVPNRKIMNDYINIPISSDQSIDKNIYKKSKIKYIS